MSTPRSSSRVRRTTAPAASAARRAWAPWPAPSTPATSVPPARRSTTATSPLTASPARGRPATPTSTAASTRTSSTAAALLAQALELVAHAPLRHRHGGAPVGVRVDIELVHESSGARQPEPQAAARGVAVAQRGLDVADPRTAVARDHHEPVAVGLLAGMHHDLARADVHDDVARHLRDRGR